MIGTEETVSRRPSRECSKPPASNATRITRFRASDFSGDAAHRQSACAMVLPFTPLRPVGDGRLLNGFPTMREDRRFSLTCWKNDSTQVGRTETFTLSSKDPQQRRPGKPTSKRDSASKERGLVQQFARADSFDGAWLMSLRLRIRVSHSFPCGCIDKTWRGKYGVFDKYP